MAERTIFNDINYSLCSDFDLNSLNMQLLLFNNIHVVRGVLCSN